MALNWTGRVDEAGLVALAARLARTAPPRALVFLEGPLGAGKTTLVRAFLRALGVTGAVRSPTYTLVEPYDLHGRVPRIRHLDLYRLADPEELEYLGLREEFEQALLLIEWPQQAGGALPPADLRIELAYLEDSTHAGEAEDPGRQISLKPASGVGEDWLRAAGLTA